MTSERTLAMSNGNAGSPVMGMQGALSSTHAASTRLQLVQFLILVLFALCMSAVEELLVPFDPLALNPYVGAVKMVVLVLGAALVFLCRSSKNLRIIAGPFGWLMAWACLCWIVTGAEMLPLRNLVSSFGGILVLAGLCGAAQVLGGVRGMIRLMVWALVFCAVASVCLGFLGIQPMPGENLRSGQLELFHGIGMPQYMTAACACLITWVLARQLADPSARSIGPILLLLVVPVLSLYRAFLIGIVTSIIVAALIGVSRRRQNPGKKLGSGVKRLLLLTLLSLVLGTVAFWMKTSTREEGNELSGREIIWPIEIASIIQHPWFGLGPFGDVQLLFFDEGLNEVGAAHSEYLGAAVCYGLPGLFLFIGTLVALRRRIRRSLPSTLEERICKDAALLSLVALSTTIIAENVIRDPRLFALYLLFPALCLSAGAAGSQKAVR